MLRVPPRYIRQVAGTLFAVIGARLRSNADVSKASAVQKGQAPVAGFAVSQGSRLVLYPQASGFSRDSISMMSSMTSTSSRAVSAGGSGDAGRGWATGEAGATCCLGAEGATGAAAVFGAAGSAGEVFCTAQAERPGILAVLRHLREQLSAVPVRPVCGTRLPRAAGGTAPWPGDPRGDIPAPLQRSGKNRRKLLVGRVQGKRRPIPLLSVIPLP